MKLSKLHSATRVARVGGPRDTSNFQFDARRWHRDIRGY